MEAKPLSVKDMNTISEAILNLVFYYPDFPFTATQENVQWQNLGKNEGIGIYTLQGAVYSSKYISGDYKAKVPFRIVYKCNADSNGARINKQSVVEKLSEWLENCSAELKNENIEIEKLERTSPVYKIDADESGYEQYTCTMSLKYYYRKERV